MKVEFLESFLKDLRSVNEKHILAKVKETIELIEKAEKLDEILHLKKMHGGKGYFRIRIRNYRLGLKLEAETIIFIRFLNRKEIYRFFP